MSTSAVQEVTESAVLDVSAGGVRVVAVRAEERQDSDSTYVHVAVKLSPPADLTWDPDEFYEVRSRVRAALVGAFGGDADLQINFSSDPLEDGDPDEGGPSSPEVAAKRVLW